MEYITPSIRKWNKQRKNGKLNVKDLPMEKIYPVQDRRIRSRLDMK